MALANAHIGGNHDVTLAIVHAGDVGIAGTAFDAGVLFRVEDWVAIVDVLIVVAIMRYCIRGPFSLITHVTIEITIIALY